MVLCQKRKKEEEEELIKQVIYIINRRVKKLKKMSTLCNLCALKIEQKNRAIFDCGHMFHLSCVLLSPFSSQCSECSPQLHLRPDLGMDRAVAMSAELLTKISERRLKPAVEHTFLENAARFLTPLTPVSHTFIDHMKQNKKLSVISTAGFGPEDAVQERLHFADICAKYNGEDILNFGFTWDHMTQMRILPTDLKHFTWPQQQHKLKLNAEKMLQMRLTITELAEMQYTTHQLIELGFTWQILASMGANVDTWKSFNFNIDDIKRYWAPTLSQWVSAGFFDKERVNKAGWPLQKLLGALPAMDSRCSGRVLRLAF